ncbi:hypothetical protein NC652_015196 [Populus alba x Populus x berolinensis]|nr:hypothetical protein NC652_015196 [Populus alba x Populus x berolinensis]
MEIRSFVDSPRRRVANQSISRVCWVDRVGDSAWIDRERIDRLMKGLKDPLQIEEDELVGLLSQFETRVLQGCSTKVREQCAFVVSALNRFNQDVLRWSSV